MSCGVGVEARSGSLGRLCPRLLCRWPCSDLSDRKARPSAQRGTTVWGLSSVLSSWSSQDTGIIERASHVARQPPLGEGRQTAGGGGPSLLDLMAPVCRRRLYPVQGSLSLEGSCWRQLGAALLGL